MGCGASRQLELLSLELTQAQRKETQLCAQVQELEHAYTELQQHYTSSRDEYERLLDDTQMELEDGSKQVEKTSTALKKTQDEVKRLLQDGAETQEQLNSRRKQVEEQKKAIATLSHDLEVAQEELSKWYRRSLAQDNQLDVLQASQSELKKRYDQVASRKLAVLAQNGRVFEVSGGKARAV